MSQKLMCNQLEKGYSMDDNELILFDRLNVIKDVNKLYDLENNSYLSFSGGKDSTILHYLIDLALPNNKIPRVYVNTGIEYKAIVDFVKDLQKEDDRIIIIQPKNNIKQTLEEYGYPFKSKEHSWFVKCYQEHSDEIDKYKEKIENDKSLLSDYEFIHNLPYGVKSTIKYLYGKRERERELYDYKTFPNSLNYQFNKGFQLKISDSCCIELKEKPIAKYEKENNKPHKILGLRKAEGGRRATLGGCKTFKNNKLSFSPLYVVSNEWEQWFIDKYNIKLAKLYYPPYNFERTGCKGCPFSLKLQEQLDTMDEFDMRNERNQCEIIWKPVYQEMRRIGYRLRKEQPYQQEKLF